ncbi:DUF6011 domain-containing protein [Streptomyces bacillaris]|uniref:DUF6011 domain-containing protein n=1 Tax=Streptomyces bacillaris TaxID=68179 RepID=UPI0036554193
MDGVAGPVTDTCGVCNRPLLDPESRAAGIGPTCARKFTGGHGTAGSHQLTFEENDMTEQPKPARYRKLPVEITAVQLRWSSWSLVCELLGDALLAENPDGAYEIPETEAADTCGEPGPGYISLKVRTAHDELATVRHGDWIIPEAQPGRFYPCKPEVFAATYELADTPKPAGRCGNDPRTVLSPGDQAAVTEFKGYLAEKRRADEAEAVLAETKKLLERRTTTLRKRAETAEAAIKRTVDVMRAYVVASGGAGVNPKQVIDLLSPTWPNGNHEAPAPGQTETRSDRCTSKSRP